MSLLSADQLAKELEDYSALAAANAGSREAIKPGHRVPFHWPRHPVSADYHVLASDWTGSTTFEAHGEVFEVEVARTPNGIFGRCPALRAEARGDSIPQMLDKLSIACEPLFAREFAKARALQVPGRYTGAIRNLEPLDLLKMLYCDDRDVANSARIEIETHASTKQFGPALLTILKDQQHPNRRIAQWCVLDLLEDLNSFFESESEQREAVGAIGDLINSAQDDYARAIFKAGVVLGGHVSNRDAFDELLRCLRSPSKISRRSAIHGLFHLAEWRTDFVDEIVKDLLSAAEKEHVPELAKFARSMAEDIKNGELDHMTEPTFDDEP